MANYPTKEKPQSTPCFRGTARYWLEGEGSNRVLAIEFSQTPHGIVKVPCYGEPSRLELACRINDIKTAFEEGFRDGAKAGVRATQDRVQESMGLLSPPVWE